MLRLEKEERRFKQIDERKQGDRGGEERWNNGRNFNLNGKGKEN